MEGYRVARGKPAKPKVPESEASAAPPPGGIAGDDINRPMETQNEVSSETPEEGGVMSKAAKEKARPEPRDWLDDFDPPHKQVDFNEICLAVMNYGKKLERGFAGCKKFDRKSEVNAGCCAERCGNWYKREAVEDIIALLHAGL
jgi:hypothetical protein